MLLVYMSISGYVEKFIKKVGMESIELIPSNIEQEIDEDYIIVIPTYVGYINYDIERFVEYKDNLKHLVGFASSGNINFGDLFCINGKELSEQYNKPLIFTFEFDGTESDVIKFKEEVQKIEISRAKQKS